MSHLAMLLKLCIYTLHHEPTVHSPCIERTYHRHAYNNPERSYISSAYTLTEKYAVVVMAPYAYVTDRTVYLPRSSGHQAFGAPVRGWCCDRYILFVVSLRTIEYVSWIRIAHKYLLRYTRVSKEGVEQTPDAD